ncbi:MAG: ABC transporter permease [Candidatus Aminicenantes bacterium]|nr:ABC transporter permease [Candidatus Aminicenantes bacterium]
MFKNYLKVALRNLYRNKLYSGLNILGLALGVACCLFILFYVKNELSFDRYHQKSGRIFRVNMSLTNQEGTIKTASTTYAYGVVLKEDFSEIENIVRFTGYGGKKVVQYGDAVFYEEKLLWADSMLFDVFSFALISGNPEQALVEPNTIVITEEMAEKYFGSEDPIGKSLQVNQESLYMVTGVMKHIPQTSLFRPDFFASFESLNLKPTGNKIQDLMGNLNYYTYILLGEKTDFKALGQKFTDHLNKHLGLVLKAIGASVQVELQPLTNIYLHSDRENELERVGDISYVYLFSGIGLFILLIACLNFMNLTTARSANRAKEVGLRKVVGAQRKQLIKQFLSESTFLTLISIVIAVFLVIVLMPVFENISGKELSVVYFMKTEILLGILALFAITSLIGGSYPAFFLSAFRPVEVIQGRLRRGVKSSGLRIGLVALQFVVSIVLIIGTFIINDQLHYIRNKKLGYDMDHIISFRLRSPETQKRFESIKTEMLRHPNILSASASDTPPLGESTYSMFHATDKPPSEMSMLFGQWVDEDFVDTYKMEVIRGRYFSKEYPFDAGESAVINEAAVKSLGWLDEPIGKEIELFNSATERIKYKVVGVVRDYHFQSLHKEIGPMLLLARNPWGNFTLISVRVKPERIQETLAFMKSKWAEFDTQYPFEYEFIDDRFDALYRTEERLEKLFRYFTILAIIIGCLGLFGLTSFTTEQRTKEIGIRKVLGASIPNIIFMLIREFTKWVFLAAVIAWPIAYFLMNSWLRNFAYRVGLAVTTFVFATLLALFIAVGTVGYQAVKAAFSSPAESLKYE